MRGALRGRGVAWTTVVRFVMLMLLGASFSGCGRQGPPRPPEFFAPRAVEQLMLTGTVDGVRLQWQAPQLQADGEPLEDLERFRIYRADFVEQGRPNFDPIADIPFVPPRVEEEQEEEKDTLPGLQQRRAPKTEAVMVNYVDETVEPGRRYLYYVVPYGGTRTPGALSPTMMVTFIGEASQVELYVR